ncbi:Mth938-like domain-containing protein [Bacteroidota bacterium]
MAKINSHSFGNITIDKVEYEHDVIIRIDGRVDKRNKKLSKKIFGNSHQFSRAEAEHAFEEGADAIVIGSGHYGELKLSDEARKFFAEKRIDVLLMNTKKAVVKYNELDGKVIGLFHTTC